MRVRPIKKYVRFSDKWRSQNKSKKEKQLLKPPIEQMPTVPVMVVNVREQKTSRQPTPRRAALVSARKILQAIRAIGRPVTKHAWFMSPGTLWKSVKYSRVTPRNALCSGHTNRKKPAPEATKIMVRPSTMVSHDEPIPKKKKRKNQKKKLTLIGLMHPHQRMDIWY